MKIEMTEDNVFGAAAMNMDTSSAMEIAESSPMSMNEDSSSAATFHQLTSPVQQHHHQQQQQQQQQQQPMTEDEIFRSMKINDTSKTPYSDATQVKIQNELERTTMIHAQTDIQTS